MSFSRSQVQVPSKIFDKIFYTTRMFLQKVLKLTYKKRFIFILLVKNESILKRSDKTEKQIGEP